MNAITYHLLNGNLFFLGAGMLSLAALFGAGTVSPPRTVRLRVVALVGLACVVVSATPLPLILYGVWTAAIGVWLVFSQPRFHHRKRVRILAGLAPISAAVVAIAFEAPYHLRPRIPPVGGEVLHVVGDSISAGIGESGATTWPAILGRQHDVHVMNFAQPGATVTTAQEQMAQIPPGKAVILLEIGGNDLLSETSLDDFDRGLSHLVEQARRSSRLVIMLELPLPLFYNRYGAVQRKLARHSNVVLVPKRFFLQVFREEDATLDGLHLSPAGHRAMAQILWPLIEPAFG